MATARERKRPGYGFDPCHRCRTLIDRCRSEGTGLCLYCLTAERCALAIEELQEVVARLHPVAVAADRNSE